MSSQRYTDEFKTEAVKQITEGGHTVPEVAKRLGVTNNSLYKWVKEYGESPERNAAIRAEKAENHRLKKELKRVTEERDILKKAAAYFAKQSG
jgi:transposase